MNRDVLIAIYGLLQVQLKQEGVLDDSGAPKKIKCISEANQDALGLYKWLAERLKHVSEITINERKAVFNNIVKGLEREYLLNMSLFTVFMFENLIYYEGTNEQKIILLPKINRLVKWLRANIIMDNDDGFRIVKDSKIGASNVMRVFNGQCELTKDMRELNVNKWRNVAQNNKKSKGE